MGSFINPYTFIPVHNGSKKSLREYYNSHADLISGKIECTLLTRSQIALCDEVSERVFDFFNVDGKPIIPGSSLRGTVRSLYEALTDSCFSSTNDTDEDYFSSRLNKNKCGLLCRENGKYVLYEAKRYKDESNKRVRDIPEGTLVCFNSYVHEKKKTDAAQERRGFNNKKAHEEIFYFRDVNSPDSEKKGYVHKVERFFNKFGPNFDSVFEKKGDIGKEVSDKYIKRLEANIKLTELDSEKNKNKFFELKSYRDLFNKMKDGEAVLPVWYCYLDGHYYFAPSQMSRAVFYNKPIDLLRNKHLDKCSDINNICEACALFGTVKEKDDKVDGFALSSRVRFSDAVCVTPDCLDESYILDVLGAPRLSSFEFYLKYNGKDESYTADTPGVEISGRKYYWHNRYIASHPIDKDAVVEIDNLKRKVQLVRKGSEFRFTVYFDRITEDQLRKLVFTLNLGDNSRESKQCHKVGHGKPLGLGSAKIVCDRITVRKFEYPEYIEKDMTDVISSDLRNVFENKNNVDNVLKVTNINTVNGKDISYPYSTDGNGVFKWFANNRPTLKKIGEPLEYIDKLPKLTDEDQTLICNNYQDNKKRSSQKK